MIKNDVAKTSGNDQEMPNGSETDDGEKWWSDNGEEQAAVNFGEPLPESPISDNRNDSDASPTGVDDAQLEISAWRATLHKAELN